MTKRKPEQELPTEDDYTDDELESQELARDPSPVSAEPLPEPITELDAEDFPPDEPPTPEELGHQYSTQFLDHLLSGLPDLDAMPSWDLAMYQSSQGELMEQLIEGFNQFVQVTRTTTFDDTDDMRAFLIDCIQCLDAISPVLVAFTLVKYHIRANRP